MIQKLAIFLLCATGAGNSLASACSDVFFVTFDAELYIPKTEETIESTAFEHLYIKSKDFEGVISNASQKSFSGEYEPDNTRALVKHRGQNYFIDRDGVVRHSNKYVKIDSRAFEKILTKDCKED